MNVLSLIGRIIFGGYFLISGLNHFLNLESMTGYAASKGVPMPNVAVIVSGLLLLVGGAMVLVGWKVQWGALLIILFLVPVTLMMHDFWAIEDSQEAQTQRANFMKNFGLVGASLMIASIRWWPLAVEKPGATHQT